MYASVESHYGPRIKLLLQRRGSCRSRFVLKERRISFVPTETISGLGCVPCLKTLKEICKARSPGDDVRGKLSSTRRDGRGREGSPFTYCSPQTDSFLKNQNGVRCLQKQFSAAEYVRRQGMLHDRSSS